MLDAMSPTLIPFAAGLALAAVHDVRNRRVPNALVLTFALMGLLVQGLTGGALGMASGLLGGLLGGGLLFVVFAFGLIGAADVKLLAAIGIWLGPKLVLTAAFYSLLAGGAIGIILLLANGDLRRDLKNRLLAIVWLRKLGFEKLDNRPKRKTVPFAAGLAIGALVAVIKSGGPFHV